MRQGVSLGRAGRVNAGWLGRPGVLAAAYAALLALVAIAIHAKVPERLDAVISDAEARYVRANHPRPAANEVVVVGLDEPFLESVREPIALMHPHIARFLAAMMVAKPSVVGFDVVFPNRSYRFLTAAGETPAPSGAPAFNFDLVLVRAL